MIRKRKNVDSSLIALEVMKDNGMQVSNSIKKEKVRKDVIVVKGNSFVLNPKEVKRSSYIVSPLVRVRKTPNKRFIVVPDVDGESDSAINGQLLLNNKPKKGLAKKTLGVAIKK